MAFLDWGVLAVYIALVVAMSFVVGRTQKSQEDYYLGGRAMPSWQIALSVTATQVSAISLIGAPAFVALKAGGGLKWLQYEFAVPLAMMLIMLILVPLYHRTGVMTVYEYLERRFGRATRTTLSLVFLLSRGLGTGVILLATSIVTAAALEIPLGSTILLIGGVALLYTAVGGIKADIYSDIAQLVVLWLGTFVCLGVVLGHLGGQAFDFFGADHPRLKVFDFAHTGLGDGQTFSFWPMVVGGLFLYLSYYGCDQGEAQRLLTAPSARTAQKALLINGLLRFPLVLTYCTFGLLLIPFLRLNPEFAASLADKRPDFLVPTFLLTYVPTGLVGLIVAGIFAASMSSLDSYLNSLSAAAWRDFIEPYWPAAKKMSPARQVRLSRALTVFWGGLATLFALLMIRGPETVLVLVNKIGSAFYGPILATFWLGMLTRRSHQNGVLTGLVTGVGVNVLLWLFFPRVSWLWWNVIGFGVAFGLGFGLSLLLPARAAAGDQDLTIFVSAERAGAEARGLGKRAYLVLGLAFCGMVAFSWALQGWLLGRG